MIPRVVDLSHHNIVTNFSKIASAGIWGMIHKATQGTAYADPKYEARRAGCAEAGLLFGAYHFNTGDPVVEQAKHFLDVAQPDPRTLVVLDYEDNRLSNMSIAQAADFCRRIEAALGRKCVIYSGNRLKENIGSASVRDRTYICSHRLWLCQYGPRTVLPKGFSNWWLWQYTGDGVGPSPHSIAGVKDSGVDLNVYAGTQAQLAADWVI